VPGGSVQGSRRFNSRPGRGCPEPVNREGPKTPVHRTSIKREINLGKLERPVNTKEKLQKDKAVIAGENH